MSREWKDTNSDLVYSTTGIHSNLSTDDRSISALRSISSLVSFNSTTHTGIIRNFVRMSTWVFVSGHPSNTYLQWMSFNKLIIVVYSRVDSVEVAYFQSFKFLKGVLLINLTLWYYTAHLAVLSLGHVHTGHQVLSALSVDVIQWAQSAWI